MKLWVFSDLHIDVIALGEPLAVPEGIDACVIAGDVREGIPAGVEWIAEHVPVPCVYVAGNHEFYRGSVREGLKKGREAARAHGNIHFLENGSAEIGGVRFLGATLWTDFRLTGDPAFAMEFARTRMNDFRQIAWAKEPWERFTPPKSVLLHHESKAWLEKALAEPFDGTTVVVTHHCPHPRSIHPSYKGETLNAAFTSDLSELIAAGRPRLWVHGHTHFSFRYVEGETEIVCNPRGYGNENVAGFDPGLVIDTDAPVNGI